MQVGGQSGGVRGGTDAEAELPEADETHGNGEEVIGASRANAPADRAEGSDAWANAAWQSALAQSSRGWRSAS